ncbi:MAG: type II secretion system protein N [Mariprofundales bacterium]|nr:type II secretion system protein N [Mariprofundales bacterium]
MRYIKYNHLLIIIFVLTLLCFAWIRWDPTPWLNAQLANQGLQNSVQIESAEKSMLGLRLHQVHLTQPTGGIITLATIEIHPAWLTILRGIPALHIQTTMAGSDGEATIALVDGTIALSKIQLNSNAKIIAALFSQAAIIQPSGSLHLSGAITLNRQNGMPLQGNITLHWSDAASPLLGTTPLGDFSLTLSSQQGKWQWGLKGGKTIATNGAGTVTTSSASLTHWGITGHIHIQAHGSPPAIIAAMLHAGSANVVISGTLSQPISQIEHTI